MEENWWLREQDRIEIEEPANAGILAHAKSLKDALGLRTGQPLPGVADIPAALHLMTRSRIGDGSCSSRWRLAGRVACPRRRAGRRMFGGSRSAWRAGSQSLTNRYPQTALARAVLRALSLGGLEEEARFERDQSIGGPAPRTDAAQHLLRLCQLKSQLDADILKRLEDLLSDPHPAVRGIVAAGLTALWAAAATRCGGLPTG